jgi:aspartyl-tRNA(Asn)/glutamyl-tRNA(Gln) amidotransferase subunit A
VPKFRDDDDLGVSPIDGLPLTISAAARGLRSGRWTAVELLELTHRRTDILDPLVHAFASQCREAAHRAAGLADAHFASGVDRGPLQGVPVAIKDMIATADAPTRAQSSVLEQPFFDGRDATVVERLRDSGAVLTGKSVTMEFALGVPDASVGQVTTRNPFDLTRWTGGSSTGMGAGTQAGLFLGGLGTDTAGSVRLPSSMCGITGLRPTLGTVPNEGVVPLAWSLDTVGPMARSAHDCALILSAISEQKDAVTNGLTGSVQGLRIGIDERMSNVDVCHQDVATRTDEALGVLKGLGAQVVPIELPHYEELSTVATLVMCSEAFAYHRSRLQSHWDRYGAGTRASLLLGALTGSADYVQAQRVRRAVASEVADLFSRVDVVATPTTLAPAPPVEGLDLGGIVALITTPYWSALGAPAVSFPIGFSSEGLPVGLQVAGPPFADSTVLRVADAYQRVTGHHLLESPEMTNRLAQNL